MHDIIPIKNVRREDTLVSWLSLQSTAKVASRSLKPQANADELLFLRNIHEHVQLYAKIEQRKQLLSATYSVSMDSKEFPSMFKNVERKL